MKKLLSLLLALAMVLSLAACGGAEEEAAPAPAPAPAETQAAAPAETEAELTYEEVVAALAEMMPYAFIGADDDGLAYYMMYDEDISYGALCILDSEANQSLVTLGNVVEESDGTLTITDEQDGYAVNFAVEAFPDAEIPYLELTMTDGALVTMGAEDAAEVADMILTIEMNTEVIIPET